MVTFVLNQVKICKLPVEGRRMKIKRLIFILVVFQLFGLSACNTGQPENQSDYVETNTVFDEPVRIDQDMLVEQEINRSKAEQEVYKGVPTLDEYMNQELMNQNGTLKTYQEEDVPWYD